MVATTTPLSLIYLVLVLVQGLGVEAPVAADYLAEGVPAYAVFVDTEDDGLLVIRGMSYADAPELVVRAEQSDIASHTYLVHGGAGEQALLVSLEGVLAELTGVGLSRGARQAPRSDAGLAVTVPLAGASNGNGGSGGASVSSGLGSTLHIVSRPGVLILSAPETDHMLVVYGER